MRIDDRRGPPGSLPVHRDAQRARHPGPVRHQHASVVASAAAGWPSACLHLGQWSSALVYGSQLRMRSKRTLQRRAQLLGHWRSASAVPRSPSGAAGTTAACHEKQAQQRQQSSNQTHASSFPPQRLGRQRSRRHGPTRTDQSEHDLGPYQCSLRSVGQLIGPSAAASDSQTPPPRFGPLLAPQGQLDPGGRSEFT